MDATEVIERMDRVLKYLEIKTEADRFVSLPAAAKKVNVSVYLLKMYINEGYGDWWVALNPAAHKLHYRIDVIKLADWLAGGGVSAELNKAVR